MWSCLQRGNKLNESHLVGEQLLNSILDTKFIENLWVCTSRECISESESIFILWCEGEDECT
jgi:hypothetical protein